MHELFKEHKLSARISVDNIYLLKKTKNICYLLFDTVISHYDNGKLIICC